ncbi:MAG TPA: hypothetical protein VL092_13495 [Chitinophagaceae bacterium]|nr:hypothetical protein [Chitinophagaceae bacterium]
MKKLAALLVLSVLLPLTRTWAQGCSVCTQTANQLGEKGADGLNNGIIYLALLPLSFISVLGFVWWKYNRRVKSS